MSSDATMRTPDDTPGIGSLDLDLDRSAIDAAELANVDQLPVYRRAAPGGSIHAADLLQRVEREIAHESNKDLLLYVHVPFCKYKCSFCDWVADIPTSRLTSGPQVRQVYVDAMCRQIRYFGPELTRLGYTPTQIYWGGGTPSRLEGDQYLQVAAALRESFNLSRVQEHVTEVTPDSLSPVKLEAMRSAGITRISMGVQSFSDEELRRTGRGHTAQEAGRAVEMMRAAGFDNFNIDLIVAFPDQKLDVLRESLARTVAHRPNHVTAYVYRATPATQMVRKRKAAAGRDAARSHMANCYVLTKEVLVEAGYDEYTLGYFSHASADRCTGEMYYFHLEGDWIGFGSGAVSVLGHHRLKIAHSSLDRFAVDPLSFDACEYLPARKVEAAIYALRQSLVTDLGISYENFRRFFGFSFDEVREHPAVRAFINYYKYCGAVFRNTPTNLSITPETRADAYINVWSKASAPRPGLPVINPAPPGAAAQVLPRV